MTRNDRATAYTDFLTMSANGSLGRLDETEVSALASAVSDQPVVQEAVLGQFYRGKMGSELDAEANEREMTWRRLKSDRRSAMFRSAGVGTDEAGRIAFDEMAGDPSAMLKVKERFYFG